MVVPEVIGPAGEGESLAVVDGLVGAEPPIAELIPESPSRPRLCPQTFLVADLVAEPLAFI